MFIVAQVMGFLGIITNIVSMQLEKKKQILYCFILANAFFSISYILLGGYVGGIICIIANVQTIINYFFEKKEKEIPKWLILIYFVSSFIGGMITYKTAFDILPVLGGLTYTWSIIQKEEKNIRRITLLNILLWLTYDIYILAYSTVVSDLFFITSTIIGMLRFDLKKKEKLN